jgi:hypothetical protein
MSAQLVSSRILYNVARRVATNTTTLLDSSTSSCYYRQGLYYRRNLCPVVSPISFKVAQLSLFTSLKGYLFSTASYVSNAAIPSPIAFVKKQTFSSSSTRNSMSQVASLPLLQALPPDSSLASLSNGSEADALLLLYTDRKQLLTHQLVQDSPVQSLITAYSQVDQGFDTDARLLPCETAPGGKLIVACTGSLAGDVDDVRRFVGK